MLNHVALPLYNKDGVKEKNKPEIFLFIPYILRPHQKLSPTLPSKLVHRQFRCVTLVLKPLASRRDEEQYVSMF